MKKVLASLVVTTVFLAGCSSSSANKIVGDYKIETDADLRDANLSGANLAGVKMLSDANLIGAIMPDGRTWDGVDGDRDGLYGSR